jgi:hypothetical protein
VARLLLLALLLLPACATIERERAERRQAMLLRAGFQQKPVETEAQRRQLEALPVRKLVRVPYQDEHRYVYGDLDGCRCLFAGTEGDYRRYLDDVVREYAQKENTDVAIGSPVSAADRTLYENAAREAILDPRGDARLDWAAWGAWD